MGLDLRESVRTPVRVESCCGSGSHALYSPSPQPSPEGEGAELEGFTITSPSGRETQGEGICDTILGA